MIASYLCLVNAQGNLPTDSTEMITISRTEFDAIQKRLSEFEEKILSLQHQVLVYQKMIFGAKSERHVSLDQSQISMELEGIENPVPGKRTVKYILHRRSGRRNFEASKLAT